MVRLFKLLPLAAGSSLLATSFEIQGFEAHPCGNVVVATTPCGRLQPSYLRTAHQEGEMGDRSMESKATVRTFFLFFGVLGVIGHSGALSGGGALAWLSWIGVLLALCYIGVGLTLSTLLRGRTLLVGSVLGAGLGVSVLIVLARASWDEGWISLIDVLTRVATAVGLTWYVWENVKRLAARTVAPSPQPDSAS